MSRLVEYIQEQVLQGIQAIRVGDRLNARLCFQAALREEPDNIVILLWLAYLATSHERRVFLLNHILTLEPENERAKQGLAWAAEIAGQNRGNTDALNTPYSPDKLPDILQLKRRFGTGDLAERGKKGVIAQRARRRLRR